MYKKRMLSLLLVLALLLGMMPGAAFAKERGTNKDQVRVLVENTTRSEADGAAWAGTLVDTWVDIDGDSTMMSAIVAALEEKNISQTGAESNYISEIGGLEAMSSDMGMDGWMMLLNDWMINYGADAFTVADGSLGAGDVIRVAYTMDFGEDLGASWYNNDTTVKAVSFSAGTLDRNFDAADTDDYVLTVPADTASLLVTPTASNKNYQVRTSVNGTEYKRTEPVPVADGTVLTVRCGDPAWPSMNTSEGATEYSFRVSVEQPARGTVYVSVNADGRTAGGKDGSPVAGIPVEFTGSCTVEDALKAVHDLCFPGGAAAGFASSMGDWGPQIDRFWGKDTMSVSYLINHALAMGLSDPLKDGDRVFAFLYTAADWSDTAAYFDRSEVAVNAGEEFSLTLMEQSGYDDSWALVYAPSAGRTVTVNGRDSGLVTGADGKVSLSFAVPGTYVIGAVNAAGTLQTEPSVVTVSGTSRMEELTFGTSTAAANKGNLPLEETVPGMGKYRVGVPDANSTFACWATGSEGVTITAAWTNTSGAEKTQKITSGKSAGQNLASLIKADGKGNDTLTVTFEDASGKEVYEIEVYRTDPSLTALSLQADGKALPLNENFISADKAYTAVTTAGELTVLATPRDSGYRLTYNGAESGRIALAAGENVLHVELENAYGCRSDYVLTVTKTGTASVRITADPEDAVVFVTDCHGDRVLPAEDGSYTLPEGTSFTYTVTAYGYVGQSGSRTAVNGDVIEVKLEKSAAAPIEADAFWKNFRNSDVNMAITDVRTPGDPATTFALWEKQLGTGWTAAPSVQIIADDALIVMSGTTLYKLDLMTGEILASAAMAGSPSYGYTPMIFAEGMIFCPLGNGTIQAFNAKTLESLWIYKDALKGQALTPIIYADGFIYTGFWNGTNKTANFVCLSVTDEDPEKTDEAKLATWTKKDAGGFYWSGAVVVGNSVIFGDDEAEHTVYALDRLTGEVISAIDVEGIGHVRCSMAYDEASGRVYFAGQNGYMCSLLVDPETGALSDLKKVSFGSVQSTSTPVIYGDKIYIGLGSGISASGSTGAFAVFDRGSQELLYAKDLLGYPQCSMLLSTAYLEENGLLYFYSTYNMNPGGITLIKVDPNKKTEDGAEVVELFDCAAHPQYCITSLICGPDGTLYYKNDSGFVFAIHEHDYSEICSDETGHWKRCSCGLETEKKAHDLTPAHDENAHWQECECGFATGKEAHEFTDCCDEVSHWHECGCGFATGEEKHCFGEWTDIPDENGIVVARRRSCACGAEETVEIDVPGTGDTTHALLWSFLFLGSAVILFFRRRKES